MPRGRQNSGRRFLTPASLHNALVLDAALGCSTNTVLHLIAIAAEVGMELPLAVFNEVSGKTPHLVKLSPSGSWYMEDFHRAGGVMAVLHRLAEAGLVDGVRRGVEPPTGVHGGRQRVAHDDRGPGRGDA